MTNKWQIVIGVFFVILVIVTGLISYINFSILEEKQIQLEIIQGQIHKIDRNGTKTLTQNSTIFNKGEIIITGQNSVAGLVFNDGKLMPMQSNSIIEFLEVTKAGNGLKFTLLEKTSNETIEYTSSIALKQIGAVILGAGQPSFVQNKFKVLGAKDSLLSANQKANKIKELSNCLENQKEITDSNYSACLNENGIEDVNIFKPNPEY